MKTTMQTAVLFASCLAAALPTASIAAEQHSAVSGYQMAAIVDRAYGKSIMAGDYARAIERLSDRNKRFETSTNLCVAYTLNGELDLAASACENALTISERNADAARTAYGKSERHELAVALSNIGVVNAMRGNLRGALTHFARAVELQGDFEQAENNLNRSMTDATSVIHEVNKEA
jgi:tetratricopeptide (TPR) repeat protein